jgi:hypothetical protein
MSDIDRERARLRRLLHAKDPAVLNWRPPNGDWSIVENVRHLLFAEQMHPGGFLAGGIHWSPLGLTDRPRPEFALVGKEPTKDIDKVFEAWDKLHAPIRRAVMSAAGPDLERALWRNHRHLGIHIRVIESLLRESGAMPPARRAAR